MSLLFRIVYAAHANGTHHKLALDALRHLETADAEGWRRLFLLHAKAYMEGAKAPDNEFKDFKNHVLHVRDGYWGGALEAVEKWYGELVATLARQSWPEAVRAAGILSHYVVDPIHPFHTAQSEAENAIHRACEWSISKSYDDLLKLGETGAPQLELAVQSGPGWLRDLVCRGADIANANYERLIAHYDINRGVSDPPAGLDQVARGLVADLIVYAARTNGAVLDRAFADAGVAPPEVSLTAETLLATLQIPKKWLTRKLGDAEDRRQVEAMYDELKTTGRVEQNLPADDRLVRDLHRAEVLASQVAAAEQQRARVISAAAPLEKPKPAGPAFAAMKPVVVTTAPSTVVPGPVPATRSPGPPSRDESEPSSRQDSVVMAAGPEAQGGEDEGVPRDTAPPLPARPASPPSGMSTVPAIPLLQPSDRAADSSARLGLSDDLERAPSIGPKTAERFAALGIKTVADFLAADAGATAEKLDVRHITADVLTDWKNQAKLMMTVPGIRGTHAQLLVGSGYRSAAAIATVAPDKLAADVLTFAASPEGRRLLRDGSPPDIARIKSWVEQAAKAA